MKRIDFSHGGGFPLTQDTLDILQQNYLQSLSTLSLNIDTPIRLQGMVAVEYAGTLIGVGEGYFMYNGQIYQFGGASWPAETLLPGYVYLIHIDTTTTDVTYHDTSVYPAISERVGDIGRGSPVTDADNFPLSDLVDYGVALGLINRDSAWLSVSIFTNNAHGNFSGTIYYKHDRITDTLRIRGDVSIDLSPLGAVITTEADYGTAWNTIYCAILPDGYTPANTVYFTAVNAGRYGILHYEQPTDYITTAVGWIDPDGKVYLKLPKPATITTYTLNFTAVLPMD
jgi:hypothetical protein